MTIVHTHTGINVGNASASSGAKPITDMRPDFWAVHSRTGMHIGLWPDRADADEALRGYEGGTIMPLFKSTTIAATHNAGAQTPPHTLDALERAIADAPLTGPAKQKFVNIDARVLAWLIADSRTFAALLAAGAREDSL